MEEKSVESVEVLNCILDVQGVNIFAMKEPNYVIVLVELYGTLEEVSPTDIQVKDHVTA